MSPSTTNLVWFRDDLRVADNPALDAAMAAGPTAAVYILDEQSPGIRPLGGAARWWLHHALEDLRSNLGRLGVPLVLRRGAAQEILPEVLAASGAQAVYWNRRYGGPERAVDTGVKELVRASGGTALSFSGTLLQEPWVPLTQDGRPFKVFTPFFNALLRLPLRPALGEPLPQEPTGLPSVPSDELADWELLPSAPDWSPRTGRGLGARRDGRPRAAGSGACGDCRRLRRHPRPAGHGRHLPAFARPALGPPEPGPGVGVPQRADPGTSRRPPTVRVP